MAKSGWRVLPVIAGGFLASFWREPTPTPKEHVYKVRVYPTLERIVRGRRRANRSAARIHRGPVRDRLPAELNARNPDMQFVCKDPPVQAGVSL
jgi:hypothetical protein